MFTLETDQLVVVVVLIIVTGGGTEGRSGAINKATGSGGGGRRSRAIRLRQAILHEFLHSSDGRRRIDPGLPELFMDLSQWCRFAPSYLGVRNRDRAKGGGAPRLAHAALPPASGAPAFSSHF